MRTEPKSENRVLQIQTSAHNRRHSIFCLMLCIVHFALCAATEAQQPKSAPRVGYLSGTDRATDFRRADGIRVALRELGYIEGKTIAIEYRHVMGTQAL